MKNKLGHDDTSEIVTIICRMRENLFRIIQFEENECIFEIKLNHTIFCASVSLYSSTIVNYSIIRTPEYKYLFKQIDGLPEREIDKIDGFIIWSLLEEKYEN
jgi:hypothetical protein